MKKLKKMTKMKMKKVKIKKTREVIFLMILKLISNNKRKEEPQQCNQVWANVPGP